jgi:hypothetical protein
MTRIDPGLAATAWLPAEGTAPGVRGKPALAVQPRQRAQSVAASALSRIRAVPPDNPDRRRQALRIYLETTLLQAFGAQLALDSGFTQLLDAVQERMASDPQIAAVADRAAAALCEQAPSR